MAANTADVSVAIAATPAQVWDALTDPKKIEQYYLGAKVETDWTVGSPITWSGEWNGKSFEDKGEILTVDPERKLAYSHWSPLTGVEDKPENYHIVEVTMREADGGTDVRLTQANISGEVTEADREARGEYEKNWTSMLEGLKKVIEASGA